MELTMRERKKLTMVKAQAYWKAKKSKKSVMLDDFCESTEYCRRYAARVLHQAGQRYLLEDCLLVADPTIALDSMDECATRELFTIWHQGMVNEVVNLNVDYRIESWLYREYPGMRPNQEKSIGLQVQMSVAGLAPNVKCDTPRLVYEGSNASIMPLSARSASCSVRTWSTTIPTLPS